MYCHVYSTYTPDDRQKTSPKHVEFYSKNKFEKLVHVVGFIISTNYNFAHILSCLYKNIFNPYPANVENKVSSY